VTFVGIQEQMGMNPVSAQSIIIPNPFNKNAVIHFTNPLRQNKTLHIYNTTGTIVRTIATKEEFAIWDGRNDAGLRLSNGCYFVYFIDEPTKSLHKVIIAR
jgi:flagellar hook assembly protein FlgD